jgi:hypothetical protein
MVRLCPFLTTEEAPPPFFCNACTCRDDDRTAVVMDLVNNMVDISAWGGD